jgi:hypothetical protein
MTRLRARSSRPKQQKSRARPLRFRGARPSYGDSWLGELDVDDGLSGMVAFMKISESRFRCRVVSMRVVSDAAERSDGV